MESYVWCCGVILVVDNKYHVNRYVINHSYVHSVQFLGSIVVMTRGPKCKNETYPKPVPVTMDLTNGLPEYFESPGIFLLWQC